MLVEGLDAFDGDSYLEYDNNLISNEFVVKLGLTYEVIKNGDKVIDQKLLVSLKGELYFLNFVVNPEEDDVEPCVILGRPFLKIAKANFDFGSRLRNKRNPTKTYIMTYDGEGPSLTVNHHKTQEELPREELEAEIYKRILLLNERRPIIETLKYSDKHKKLLNSILLDKLKLDGELEGDQERLGEDVVREYMVLKEKKYIRCFILLIRLEGKVSFHALVDTGSNINMMPYLIYELLERGKSKPKINKVRMLDHSNAELYRNVPIIVERSFMYTCGAIMDTLKGRMTNFDGNVHQQFQIVKVRKSQEDSDSDSDDEEYSFKRDESGKPFYGPHQPQYLDSEDAMDHALAEHYLDPFCNSVLNTMGCEETIEEMLEIKVIEIGCDEELDEEVTSKELSSKKIIRFRLGGRGHSWSLLEFSCYLGLYSREEILEIAQWMKRKGKCKQEGSQIVCGQFVTKLAKRLRLLTNDVLDTLRAPIICRTLDTTTLRKLI
ncbi:reverse transcriptase domain-containing protein [Tanacetum coccineum]